MAQLTEQTPTELNIPSLDTELSTQSPQKILERALSLYDNIAISFSGAEDVVLIDMAYRIKKDIKVFSLDTGRLHSETYQFIDRVRKHYGITIDIMYPDAAQVEALVREKGLFSFYEDGHKECCDIRKVEPLARALAGKRAWITGQRREQAANRSQLGEQEFDAVHGVEKFNPLADWTEDAVWEYIHAQQVPYNRLYDQGYRSIGCAPCTRPVNPGEDVRAGRWWWETAETKECGLHVAPDGRLVRAKEPA